MKLNKFYGIFNLSVSSSLMVVDLFGSLIFSPPLWSQINSRQVHQSDLPTVDQWLQWEETENIAEMNKHTQWIPVKAFPFSQKEVAWAYSEKLSAEKKDYLRKAFFSTEGTNFRKKVFIPLHPFAVPEDYWDQEKKQIAHLKIPGLEMASETKGNSGNKEAVIDKTFPMRQTASRSLFFQSEDRPQKLLFSIKLPTNNLFDPKDLSYKQEAHHQTIKSFLLEDIFTSYSRSQLMNKVDQEIGEDPSLIILDEAMILYHRPTQNGLVIRDLSPLADGHLYLPAFSLPSVGKEIAESNGSEREAYWGEHYAEVMGRSMAKLLLRYGMQMETPNPQNMLIQLDPQTKKPTGRLVLRDMADSRFIRHLLPKEKENSAIAIDEAFSRKRMNSRPIIDEVLFLQSRAPFARFDRTMTKGEKLTYRTMKKWQNQMIEAYIQEVEKVLDIKIAALDPKKNNNDIKIRKYLDLIVAQRSGSVYMDDDLKELCYLIPLQEYLSSPEGQMKLEDYRQTLRLQLQEQLKEKKGESDPLQLAHCAGTEKGEEEKSKFSFFRQFFSPKDLLHSLLKK